MTNKANFSPSPKVIRSKEQTTLSTTISYDYSDSKLGKLSLRSFSDYAEQRFPELSDETECARVKVLFQLPQDHHLPCNLEAESLACEVIKTIAGECQPIFFRGVKIGFEKDIDSVDLVPSVICQAENLIKHYSTNLDALRGMTIKISMFKKAKPSAWAFE